LVLGELSVIKIHLSRLLGERRLTQADLARKTGIRPSTIGDYYHELVERMNLNHLDKICEVLECDVSDVLEYVPKRKGFFR
jgi:putative transcriptional regulator